MNKTLAFLISNDFAFKAAKSGVIEKIDNVNKLVILKYDDGTYDACDLDDKLNKNSNMGFYIHQNFKLVYSEGERFEKGDVIAYNPDYFRGKGKNIDYCPGALAKVAIAAGDFSFEDSTLISESLGEKCAAYVNMLKQTVLSKNSEIYSIVEEGDIVEPGDELIEFSDSFEDPETTEFLAKLATSLDADMMNDITHETVNAKYAGKITKVEIYYNCNFEELTPSVQNIIKKYKNKMTGRVKALGNIDTDSVHIPVVEKVDAKRIIKEEFPEDGGVIINIWIEYKSVMGMRR